MRQCVSTIRLYGVESSSAAEDSLLIGQALF